MGVTIEPYIMTAVRLQKPDQIACDDSKAMVIDEAVPYETTPSLSAASQRKTENYDKPDICGRCQR